MHYPALICPSGPSRVGPVSDLWLLSCYLFPIGPASDPGILCLRDLRSRSLGLRAYSQAAERLRNANPVREGRAASRPQSSPEPRTRHSASLPRCRLIAGPREERECMHAHIKPLRSNGENADPISRRRSPRVCMVAFRFEGLLFSPLISRHMSLVSALEVPNRPWSKFIS